LPHIRDARDRYVIVGAGKTAMDACLWLLRHGVAPQRLTWIKPRDAWMLDRAGIQPGSQFAKKVLRDFSNQLAAVLEAESLADLFDRLEAKGCLLRIDESVEPTMYRCAILSRAELAELRRIEDVVRLGHVQAIEPGRVILDDGSLDVHGSALYIDCSADGFAHREPTPVFCGDHISLQAVRTCQPAFSAAAIAHVEAAYPDDQTRNAFCGPVPYPGEPARLVANDAGVQQESTTVVLRSRHDGVGRRRPAQRSAPRKRRRQRAGAREDHLGAELAAARHQRQAGKPVGAGVAAGPRGQGRAARPSSDAAAKVGPRIARLCATIERQIGRFTPCR
jgi:hypothetical protein